MRVCVLTILDNLGNIGSLVQASSMLKVFKAEAVVWKREEVWNSHISNCSESTLNYYRSLNIKEEFTDYHKAAEYINKHYDIVIVGSDELWKAGNIDDTYSIPYPNPFWGSAITIKKFAFAVSTGSLNLDDYTELTKKNMKNDLSEFELIYVRDKKSQLDLKRLGIHVDGLIPDPTFAIDFKSTDKLPTDDVNPEEWFASFANLNFLEHERMHKLLACIRGGTPCSSYDMRYKSKELKDFFDLPEGTKHEIIKNWPYEDISKKCQLYRKRWIEVLTIFRQNYNVSIDLPSDHLKIVDKPSHPASTIYMFDEQRTGRLLHNKGGLKQPQLVRKTMLPNKIPYSAESSAVFDKQGNIYFGCHDGNFYSLNDEGEIRWTFETSIKIYSSPVIIPNTKTLCFASGDGIFYCLNFDGELIWSVKIGFIERNWWQQKVYEHYKMKFPTLHEVNRFATVNSWSSPNILSDSSICITGYTLGLTLLNPFNGEIIWRKNLGKPKHYLAGTAVTRDDEIIAVSQQGRVFKFDKNGKKLWSSYLKRGYNAWGNPSIDNENQQIFVSVSKREHESIIYSYDFDGNKLWNVSLPEATRGAISVSYENYIICCGFKGNVYFLDKTTGNILKKIQVTDGKMWTSASIDPEGYIFVSVIDSSEQDTGRVCCYDKYGEFVWDYEMGKGHSVPILDGQNRLYFGSWSGEYFCLQT